MAAYPFQYVNRRGIPVLKTTGVTAETTGVVFSFPNHAFANSWYRGLVLVELAQVIPAGTTGTLPVLFETNGQTKNLTTYNGANVTVSDIPGTGVFQLWYDKQLTEGDGRGPGLSPSFHKTINRRCLRI